MTCFRFCQCKVFGRVEGSWVYDPRHTFSRYVHNICIYLYINVCTGCMSRAQKEAFIACVCA